MQSTTKAYISFDLIFDYNSYLFCICRSYLFRHDISIDNNYRSKIEQLSFKEIHDQINSEFLKEKGDFEEFKKIYDQYFESLKPQVGALDLIQILKDQGIQIIFAVEDNKEIIPYLSKISDIHKQWIADGIFIQDSKKEILKKLSNSEIFYNYFICSNRQFLQEVKDVTVGSAGDGKGKDIKFLEIKNSNFHQKNEGETPEDFADLIENIKFADQLGLTTNYSFPPQEFFLKLKETPIDKSFVAFNSQVKLAQDITVAGSIIQGQGKAGKELGIPTANIDIYCESIQQQIKELPTGVYMGKAIHNPENENSQSYGCLVFIGSSQYFQTPRKQLEAYLYHEFDNHFYNDYMEVTLQYFLRPEADFKAFNHLIKTIHNDVWQGKSLIPSILNN